MMIIKNKMLMHIGLAAMVASMLVGCGGGSDSANTQVKPEPAVVNPVMSKSAAITKKTADDLPHYLTRDIQDEVFYFVLPDRFNNGDTDNDNGSKTIALSRGGFDKTNAASYHGGDIKGLEQKLPYLKELGISAIWLTPILRNQAVQGEISGYHGYWVLDFTEIDPHLGTNENLKSFIDAAHEKNIKVFFDIITNHTADVIKYAECHGEDGSGWSEGGDICPYKSLAQKAAGDEYTTVIPEGSEQVKTPLWLNDTKYYHNQGDSTFEGENSVYGDFFGLDDLNTDDPEVVAGLTDVFKDIIKEFKPDGFRIDTVKHVNIEFWQSFAPALKAYANDIGLPQFFLFGEVYSADSSTLSYYTTTGKIQSVLDFGFQNAIKETIVDQKGTDKLAELFSHDHKYNDDDSNANQLLNFVGNHDMGRFAWMLQNSNPSLNKDTFQARIELAHALMYFLRGIPVVYYGAEQGFVGDGGNHESRQDMMPSQVAEYNDDDLVGTSATTADDNFDKNHPLYQAFAEYASVYYTHPALRYGQQDVIYSSGQSGIFAVTRAMASGEKVLVVANTSTQLQTQTLDLTVQSAELLFASDESGLSVDDAKAIISLPSLSLAIYTVK